MITITYVSVGALSVGEAALQVDDIVKRSLVRNASLSITGALVFTGAYFAQVLEGQATNVDALMESILRDDRHRQLLVVERRPITRRQFASWHMAYHGLASYVAQPIQRLLDLPSPAETRGYVARIHGIMTEFVQD